MIGYALRRRRLSLTIASRKTIVDPAKPIATHRRGLHSPSIFDSRAGACICSLLMSEVVNTKHSNVLF